MPVILLLPRNAIDTTHYRKLGCAEPSSQGVTVTNFTHTLQARGRPGGTTSRRKEPGKGLTSREGGRRTSGPPSDQGLTLRTGMLSVRHAAAGLHYWHCTDFSVGGAAGMSRGRHLTVEKLPEASQGLLGGPPNPRSLGEEPWDRPKGRRTL